MERFHIIDDGAVILRLAKGQHRQAKVYRRGKEIYAGHSGGFYRLLGKGGVSQNTDMKWVDMEAVGVEMSAVSGTPEFVA